VIFSKKINIFLEKKEYIENNFKDLGFI
jgi:hypothetical protein